MDSAQRRRPAQSRSYDHLLTTSGSRITDAEVWKDLDYTQDHYYDMPDLQRLFNNVAPNGWRPTPTSRI